MSEKNSKVMIEAKGLSKFYESFVAIENVSFSVPEGQVVAFLGPNGAGKSTTMRILSGYLAPSEGSAKIAGFDVAEARLKAAAHLGYLPENGPLYLDMTPYESLQFFGEARGLEPAKLKTRIETVTELAALQEVLDKPIGRLSKGYRQRVGLAQALLHDPDVLIMDEPTSGLDPNQIRDFRANIKVLGKTKTILLSTHILQEVEAVAERVIFINEGRLVFDGSPAELHAESSLEEAFYRLTSPTETQTTES
ncbi:ABC transporter-related protein [Chloroherpeton thalassium ATCC 35110]|uniref:ABC transporter-related protein n=1 Tax=Chloroherpeton thalassium (strain ATCC 35110 / GB-78) TaxID=517418 RepID=B3QTZ1_CHLT3|nr:ATP-binding cassette domain-containing protein [Chloroherpeton thalassium]ACF12789.1 ABC transporter-related protein [Chloroherpeton thalassium ATCC 35110]